MRLFFLFLILSCTFHICEMCTIRISNMLKNFYKKCHPVLNGVALYVFSNITVFRRLALFLCRMFFPLGGKAQGFFR
jgi:hypothetical protein